MLKIGSKLLIYKSFDGLKLNAQVAVFFIGKPPKEVIILISTCKHRKARLQQPGYLFINQFSGSPRQVGPEIQPFDQPRVLLRDEWKSRAHLTPEGKAALTPENLFVLPPVKS